jgi:hypothetical protein
MNIAAVLQIRDDSKQLYSSSNGPLLTGVHLLACTRRIKKSYVSFLTPISGCFFPSKLKSCAILAMSRRFSVSSRIFTFMLRVPVCMSLDMPRHEFCVRTKLMDIRNGCFKTPFLAEQSFL